LLDIFDTPLLSISEKKPLSPASYETMFLNGEKRLELLELREL
jgi:hypothetical protein